MSIRARLSKLEAAINKDKPLFEMVDAEIEQFLRRHLGLAVDAPISDQMLLQVALSGEVLTSKCTHEEALDLMSNGA